MPAVPDAIRQLDALDRALLIRRDLERLVGVSTGRATALMTAVGAGRTGPLLTLPRADLLRQRRRPRTRAAVRGEAPRLAGLPAGVSVEPGRIAVRFRGAKDAVGRLVALAQALTHDYEPFEALVEEGEAAGGGGLETGRTGA